MKIPTSWKQPSDGYILGREGVSWKNEKTKGIFKKSVVEVQIITNYRIVKNDFDIMLKDIDDITVINQHRISQSHSNYIGTYGVGYTRFGTGNTTSRSKTIGDVVFMIDGRPVIIFHQIVDPHGVARLAKNARKQIIQTIKAIEKEDYKRQIEMEKAAKQKIVRKIDVPHIQNNNYSLQTQDTKYFRNSITDKDEIEEINKIREMLNSNEKVLFVTNQSKIKPGGSYFSPNTIYATNKRIIIRDPYMLGIKTNVFDISYDIITNLNLDKGLLSSTIKFKVPKSTRSNDLEMIDSIIKSDKDFTVLIEGIPNDQADDLIKIIHLGIQDCQRAAALKKQKIIGINQPEKVRSTSNQLLSIADELQKLIKLKKEGVLTEQEFNQMKQKLLK